MVEAGSHLSERSYKLGKTNVLNSPLALPNGALDVISKGTLGQRAHSAEHQDQIPESVPNHKLSNPIVPRVDK